MTKRDKTQLKPYMAFSQGYGPQEGAILVLAHNANRARGLAWQSNECLNVEDWLDQAALLIKDQRVICLADQSRIKLNEPHVVSDPTACIECGFWGCGITADGLCAHCNCPPGDELIKRYRQAGGKRN